METATFGQTGIQVSRLGFGGAPAGLTNYLDRYTPADAAQRRQVIDALHTAVELGITYFDTAPGYGQGVGEEIFGEGLAGTGDSIFLATKVSPSVMTAGGAGHGHEVRASLEESLRRLRRDRVDLLQIHGTTYSRAQADAILAPKGMLDQLCELRDEGLTRFIGFTSEDQNEAVYRFIADGRFDVIQIAYNVLSQHPYETTRPFGAIVDAEAQRMGIVTMRTLTSGLFQRWINRVHPTNTFDFRPALLQFVLSNPLVDVALVGMRGPREVMENVRICNDHAGRIDLSDLQERYV